MRLAAQAKGGYYPTPEQGRRPDRRPDSHAHPATTAIGSGRRCASWTPAAGAGDAAGSRLAEEPRPARESISIETYGVELHRDRAEACRGAARPRTLASDLFATSIANGAFGLAAP